MFKASIEELQWSDVRESVAKLNKSLATIIDEINPDKRFPLYRARYPYGSEILINGVLQLPNHDGKIVPYNSSDVKKSMQENLGYNQGSNPVSMILNNSAQLFTKIENRIIPVFDIVYPGNIFGLWFILNSNYLDANDISQISPSPINWYLNSSIWNMTAGARCIFMLPKISKVISHHKLLQKLNIQSSVPNDLLDHWHVFKEIEIKADTKNNWILDILFFSKKWVQALNHPKWIKLQNYLFKNAWYGSSFWRQKFIWDMIFAAMQEKKNIKPDPYITNTVEHLFAMGIGAAPGFAPATDDLVAPIKKIQTVYRDIYQLEYAPIIMQPLSFSIDRKNSRPVYYSLEFPTMINMPSKARVLASKITDLVQIQHVLNKFSEEVLFGALHFEQAGLANLVRDVKYSFYHTDTSRYMNILSSNKIPLEDSNFIINQNDDYKLFPENSPFLRGCIKISLDCDKK